MRSRADNHLCGMDAEELKRIADRVPAFRGLTSGQLHKLLKVGELKRYERGEVLCTQGEESTEMFVLVSGTLAVISAGVELSLIDSSNIVGEMSLITGLPRCATLEVRADVTVFEISQLALNGLLQHNPDLAARVYRNIITSMCAKLREANAEVLRALMGV